MSGADRVLLVETDSAALERVSTGLRQAGFAVDAVVTMADALDALADRSYPVVVADYDLPDLTGVDLLAALFGVFAVLSKPVPLEMLSLTVGAALEARRPRQV
jgi:DNA-binding response OmpR family regulator